VTSDIGTIENANGTSTPTLNNTPEWVLSWTGFQCSQLAGNVPQLPGHTAAPHKLYPCSQVSLVDAKTGAILFTTQVIHE
jgi:hypothetical protein